ncbi:hypothetical protein ACIA8G_03310 [Lentzea sp. NPDC051213]|uniref:hypothetical protein n=1 Tax=Lentzea sp. NPDC051213 TaxID=3364126 RepID=UPI0037B68E9A
MKRLVATIIVALSVLAGMAGTASAAPGEFCNLNIDTGKQTCFATDGELRASKSAAEYLLVELSVDINHVNRAWVTSTRPCTAAYDNETDMVIPNLSVISRDRNISSFVPHYCRVRFWDGLNYSGTDSPLGYNVCANMHNCFGSAGDWNDRPRSLRMT